MKVYLVTSGSYDDFSIETVFLHENGAALYCLEHSDCSYEERDVDEDYGHQVTYWKYDGEVFEEVRCEPKDLPKEINGSAGSRLDGNKVLCSFSLVSPEDASKRFDSMVAYLKKTENDRQTIEFATISGIMEFLRE